MNYIRFANAMNNTTTINTFNNDNRNIAKIKTQHCQIMTNITNKILKFEPMIKEPTVTNYTFFIVFTFSGINSFYLNQFYCNTTSTIYHFCGYNFISTVV